jgi:hypothetical protein
LADEAAAVEDALVASVAERLAEEVDIIGVRASSFPERLERA